MLISKPKHAPSDWWLCLENYTTQAPYSQYTFPSMKTTLLSHTKTQSFEASYMNGLFASYMLGPWWYIHWNMLRSLTLLEVNLVLWHFPKSWQSLFTASSRVFKSPTKEQLGHSHWEASEGSLGNSWWCSTHSHPFSKLSHSFNLFVLDSLPSAAVRT